MTKNDPPVRSHTLAHFTHIISIHEAKKVVCMEIVCKHAE